MSWLNNFKIIYKIGLIVAMLTMVMVGVVSFAVSKMRAMDDANTDFSDIQHRSFHGSSERKQHIAALGQWSDEDA